MDSHKYTRCSKAYTILRLSNKTNNLRKCFLCVKELTYPVVWLKVMIEWKLHFETDNNEAEKKLRELGSNQQPIG